MVFRPNTPTKQLSQFHARPIMRAGFFGVLIMSTEDPRFAGVARLYGIEGLERLRAAHVAVVGIGGVGSWAAEAMARCGVG